MSVKKLPTTSYAVLGILSISPMSGYELAQAAERSIANFWPVSRSQIYTELGRLEELELVRGADVEQERAPDKRVFELTPSGHDAFAGWVATPGYEPDRMRLGFCLKTFFGHHMPREVMIENLERFKAENEAHVAYLRQVIDLLSTLPEAAYTRATATLGMRISEAAATWAGELLADLPQISEPGAGHEEVHRVARELFRKAPRR
jgi:DNA-binding PadR family transcriptional regulator